MAERVRFGPETNIQQALDLDPRVGEVFRKLGLKCLDCVAAEKETLKLAALYHDKELREILDVLNGLSGKPQAASGERKEEERR